MPIADDSPAALRAAARLPPLVGGVRRGRLLAWDARDAVWEGWDTGTGERVQIRTGAPTGPLRWRAVDGAWVSEGIECALADLLPLDDPPEAAWVAGVLGGALAALAVGAPGPVVPDAIVRVRGRWTLAGWDIEPGEPLRDLGALVAGIDEGPLGERARTFVEDPPPSAADAERLFRGDLAVLLAEAHARVVLRARSIARAGRRAGLRGLVRRLTAAVPPPVARGCLRASPDGVAHLVVSDGREVRGGASAGGSPERLPVIWSGGRLEATHARAALRAWAGRATGDEAARQATTRALGGDDAAVARLLRWLAAAARLRTDSLLLETRLR